MKNRAPIILIDGSSYLYRAFFACPPLTNPQGEPTGATFGIINMIKSLVSQYNPTYIAVVFDAKGGSFRNQIYSEYKANREAMPEELVVQINTIHAIIKAMGLPLICVDGVEADDVIGTLSVQAIKKDKPVLISTGDKDMAQLVNHHVTLINTMNNQLLAPDSVIEKFGVPPKYIIDYLALMGDKSDNIPGVPGIGEKTARVLLNHFKGLNDIYSRIDDISTLPIRGSKSLKQKLLDYKKQAELSYKLATIKTDLRLNLHLDDLRIKSPNFEKLDTLFQYNGFKRWVIEIANGKFVPTLADTEDQRKLKQTETTPTKGELTKIDNGYESILTEKQFQKWLNLLSNCKKFAFDTETTSLSHYNAELIGLSFCIEPGKAAYLPVGHTYPDAHRQLPLSDVLEKLKPIFENKKILKIGQNLKYDCSVLLNYNINVKGIAFDSMLEAYLINSNGRHDLDSIATKYLGHKTITYKKLTQKGADNLSIKQIDIETATYYAAEDADVTLQLHHVFWPKIEKSPSIIKIFRYIDMPLVSVLLDMERTGVLVDVKLLQTYSLELEKKLQALEKKLFNLAGTSFNPNSPKQLQTVLFEKHQIPVVKKTPKGDPSTSEEVLVKLAENHRLPKYILNYRGLAKLKNTYTDKLPHMVDPNDHRIHTNYNQTGTVTGRLSSSYPNLQNIPVRNEEGRRIRQAFVAPKGYKIVSADYSQIELRIMAALSGDKRLREAFKENKDIHRFTAAETLGIEEKDVTQAQRRNAKAVNFGLIYGMSAFGLAKQLAISRNEAQSYINLYFNRYPGVGIYMEEIRQKAATEGYIETLTGRRLYLPNIRSNRSIERRAAQRAAINAPMQGTAADIIKIAMIQIANWIKKEPQDSIRMIMQVHDELVFEIKTEYVDQFKKQIKTIMENCFNLSVSLKVAINSGNNWDEAH